MVGPRFSTTATALEVDFAQAGVAFSPVSTAQLGSKRVSVAAPRSDMARYFMISSRKKRNQAGKIQAQRCS